MSKFNIGDKVRLKVDSPKAEGQFSRGNEYIVVRVMGDRIKVAEDDSGDENGWGARYFEPVANVGPIRTVIRKEIVPGKYGPLVVGGNGSILLPQACYTPDELREVAHTLNQIAEALEDI